MWEALKGGHAPGKRAAQADEARQTGGKQPGVARGPPAARAALLPRAAGVAGARGQCGGDRSNSIPVQSQRPSCHCSMQKGCPSGGAVVACTCPQRPLAGRSARRAKGAPKGLALHAGVVDAGPLRQGWSPPLRWANTLADRALRLRRSQGRRPAPFRPPHRLDALGSPHGGRSAPGGRPASAGAAAAPAAAAAFARRDSPRLAAASSS
jgi:hypothetical protein